MADRPAGISPPNCRPAPSRDVAAPALVAAVLLAMPGAAWSQSVESDLTPESAQLGWPESEYAVPAIVSDEALQSLSHVDE